MGWFKKKKKEVSLETSLQQKTKPIPKIDFTVPVTCEEEKDTVSVIAASILSGNKEVSSFKVKSIRRVDHDKEACAVIAAAIMSQDKPESRFRLISIKETT